MDKWFIVAVNGKKMALVLGPFDSREEADKTWEKVKHRAFEKLIPYAEWRYTWGTALVQNSGHHKGKLNFLLDEKPEQERITCYRH